MRFFAIFRQHRLSGFVTPDRPESRLNKRLGGLPEEGIEPPTKGL